jgi:hypothetical protein
MKVVLFGISALFAVGVALAQPAPTGPIDDGRFRAEYDRMPSGGDFEHYYPRDARNAGTPGVAELCCTVREDRTLECRSGFEWPQGQGFGEAAVNISKAFRLSPASYERYRAQSGAWMQVAITFIIDPAPSNLPEIRQRITEGTRGLCRPTPSAPVS